MKKLLPVARNMSSEIGTQTDSPVKLRVRTYDFLLSGVTLSHSWDNPLLHAVVANPSAPQADDAKPTAISADKPRTQRSPSKVKKQKDDQDRSPTPILENLVTPDRTFLTVKQAAQRFPIFTESAIRFLIFQAEACVKNPDVELPDNGFRNVIYRVPGQRRVLIREQNLIEWLNTGRQAAPNRPTDC